MEGANAPSAQEITIMKELIDFIAVSSYQASLNKIQKMKAQGIISSDEAVELCWATLIKTITV